MTALRRILLTGAAGSGKTALVAEMQRRGLTISRDPGQRVIRAETATGGAGFPWEDAARFGQLMLKMASADYEGVRVGNTLFDRGVFDAALVLAEAGKPADGVLTRYPYDPMVILAEPWQELFEADPERRQSFAEAQAGYETVHERLKQLGYQPETLPKASVVERADWLEALLAKG